MGVFEIFVIFVLAWWISLFITLPIGIQSQIESGNVVDGTDGGAPTKSNLIQKAKWATYAALATTILALIVYNIVMLLT